METKLAASENDATEKEELNQKLISEAKKEAEKFEAQEAKLNETILQLKTSSEMVETLEQVRVQSSTAMLRFSSFVADQRSSSLSGTLYCKTHHAWPLSSEMPPFCELTSRKT